MQLYVKNSFEEKRLNNIEFDILTKYYSFFTQKANKIKHSYNNDSFNTEKKFMRINNFQRLQTRSRDSKNKIDLEYLKIIQF